MASCCMKGPTLLLLIFGHSGVSRLFDQSLESFIIRVSLVRGSKPPLPVLGKHSQPKYSIFGMRLRFLLGGRSEAVILRKS